MLTIFQHRSQNVLLEMLGSALACDESHQRSAQNVGRSAAEYLQGGIVATGEVAFKVGRKDRNPVGCAGIGGSRRRCQGNTARVESGAGWCLRLRIEVYRWHPARLDLILTQRIGPCRKYAASNHNEGNQFRLAKVGTKSRIYLPRQSPNGEAGSSGITSVSYLKPCSRNRIH